MIYMISLLKNCMLSEIQTEKSRKNWRNFYAFKILKLSYHKKYVKIANFLENRQNAERKK